jgi:hypothetical protein
MRSPKLASETIEPDELIHKMNKDPKSSSLALLLNSSSPHLLIFSPSQLLIFSSPHLLTSSYSHLLNSSLDL